MNNRPIGIFDSGVGGLTVLSEIEKILPNENVIYFGDTARVPYGNKSKATIIKFSTQNILFLLSKRVKIVVVACNTASSLALDYLKRTFSVPIIGVIESGVGAALKKTKSGKIGVIGTKSTIVSSSYKKEILKRNSKIKVYSKACPLFVPLVEEGMLNGAITRKITTNYIKDLKDKGIDTIILGCTHYPLLKSTISEYLNKVAIVDSAQEVATHAKYVLSLKNLLNKSKKQGQSDFYVTDEPVGFLKLAKLFLKHNIHKPRVVNL